MANGYDEFFQRARARSTGNADFITPRRFETKALPKTSGRSEAELTQEIRRRLKKRRSNRPRKFPTAIVVFSIVGLLAAAAGSWRYDQLEKFLGQIEFEAIGRAMAEDKKTDKSEKASGDGKKVAAKAIAKKDSKVDVKKDDKSPAEVAEGSESAPTTEVRKTDWNDDEVNHFKKLVDRKKELESREEELARMEAELQSQREAIEKRMKVLEETRRSISSVLQEKVVEDEKKIETLVQVYSNMKPPQAAKVLEAMNEDLAVQILGRMKKKNAAEVLNLMKAEKAQSFSEKFAGYKKN